MYYLVLKSRLLILYLVLKLKTVYVLKSSTKIKKKKIIFVLIGMYNMKYIFNSHFNKYLNNISYYITCNESINNININLNDINFNSLYDLLQKDLNLDVNIYNIEDIYDNIISRFKLIFSFLKLQNNNTNIYNFLSIIIYKNDQINIVCKYYDLNIFSTHVEIKRILFNKHENIPEDEEKIRDWKNSLKQIPYSYFEEKMKKENKNYVLDTNNTFNIFNKFDEQNKQNEQNEQNFFKNKTNINTDNTNNQTNKQINNQINNKINNQTNNQINNGKINNQINNNGIDNILFFNKNTTIKNNILDKSEILQFESINEYNYKLYEPNMISNPINFFLVKEITLLKNYYIINNNPKLLEHMCDICNIIDNFENELKFSPDILNYEEYTLHIGGAPCPIYLLKTLVFHKINDEKNPICIFLRKESIIIRNCLKITSKNKLGKYIYDICNIIDFIIHNINN